MLALHKLVATMVAQLVLVNNLSLLHKIVCIDIKLIIVMFILSIVLQFPIILMN